MLTWIFFNGVQCEFSWPCSFCVWYTEFEIPLKEILVVNKWFSRDFQKIPFENEVQYPFTT